MKRFIHSPTYAYAYILLLLVLALGIVACQPQQQSPTVTPPDTPTSEPPATATEEATEPPTAEPSPTQQPSETPEPDPTATVEATPEPPAQSEYPLKVVYVFSDDVLNVRDDADPEADVVTTLEPQSSGIDSEGSGEMVGDNLWLPVEVDDQSGWANSLYLTEDVPADEFCEAEEPRELIEQLRTAIENEDAAQIAQLGDPQRGLRIRVAWWNPEVRLTDDNLQNVYSPLVSYDWGVQDGSGNPIQGSFSEEIQPLLERNLVPATEMACNQILHGATAGFVQLPEEYEGINFYSLYRSAPEEEEVPFDWGTWVEGIERWQGDYHIAFLAHIQYEI